MPDKPRSRCDDDIKLIFVIVRLVYSSARGLQYGEVVSPNGEVLSRFRALDELPDQIDQAMAEYG